MPRRKLLTLKKDRIKLAKIRAENELNGQHIARKGLYVENIEVFNIGELSLVCKHCEAKHFSKEKSDDGEFVHCCHKGKVSLQTFSRSTDIPQLLYMLLTGNDEQSKHFRKNIRYYNNALAFASMQVHLATFPNEGPYVFKVHGQIYHFVGPLHSDDPLYAALFMLDSSDALNRRLTRINITLQSDLLINLEKMLADRNPYAQLFIHMKEIEDILKIGNTKPDIPDYILRFDTNNAFDKRRYNEPLPDIDEVAASFLVDNDGCPPFEFHFTIYSKKEGICKISNLNPHTDPMVYPLLFPDGDAGWKPGMTHSQLFATPKRNAVTLLQFYSYKIAIRNNFSLLHASGKLFQQYCVDAYVKVEGSRIAYIKTHQKNLRCEKYKVMADFVHYDKMFKPGVPVILPSTFIGSPRYMVERYQDAMSIVARFGKPDLFITFTANPKWPEIVNNIKSYEKIENRPDLVARVFSLKLDQLIQEITKKAIFGKVIAYFYVIEFQKRGLPHAHRLIILEEKIRNATDIDNIVCAEIPDKHSNPRLYETVTKFMVHKPCGIFNESAPCMINGKCSRNFPKNFTDETTDNVNGYPIYRRRSDKQIFLDNTTIDNRWIVPYNPYLSIRFNAHINVEICASVKSIKYLFKYVYKGYDCASLSVITETDEVAAFLNTRYVSPPEAVWRLLERPMQKRSHSIERLPIHLPDEQFVYFSEGNEKNAYELASNKNTKLQAWFNLNKVDEKARNIHYVNIPEFYWFSNGKWVSRKSTSKTLGRIYMVHPSDRERYFLRLLLLRITGAISFDDLKTVNGITYSTFEEAAKERNLLASDNEWEKCLQEAINSKMPKQLRHLFAYICIFCAPTDPLLLWEQFKFDLSEDYLLEYDVNESFNLALYDIENVSSSHGKACITFGLPSPNVVVDVTCLTDVEMLNDRSIGEDYYKSLNNEQRAVVDIIMSNAEKRIGGLFFLDGPGGSGKTFVYTTLCYLLRERDYSVIPVAWTGIAANLLPGGRTAHSVFKFPVPLFDDSTCYISSGSEHAQILRSSALIIWDEISMAPACALNVLDRLLREIMNIDQPFGNKLILCGGDFRQILPVVPGPTCKTKIIEHCIKSSPLWRICKTFQLKTNMRAKNDEEEFCDWLKKLGEGRLPTYGNVGSNQDIIQIPNHIICNENIIDYVFGKNLTPESIYNIHQSAILCSKNDHCSSFNDTIVEMLEGESRTYYSSDEIINEGGEESDISQYSTEFLNSLTPSGLPPHKLTLKKGTIVMLIRNLNTKIGLVNGLRCVIKKLHEFFLEAEVLSGEMKNEIILIPRLDLTSSDPSLPFVLKRRQFPIRVAFALTINKCQGQTLDKVGLFLPEPVFAHGQLYVAFSRVRRWDDIKVSLPRLNEHGYFTSNIVYKEVL